MKAYFINLFNYDRHSSLQMLPLIFKAGEPEKPVLLMAHILAAQQVWLGRCKGLAAANTIALWPPAINTGIFEETINNNHADWVAYLNSIDDDKLQQTLEYKNMQGLPFSSKLVDIFTHVINHGTHHRAQIGQHLKPAGITQLPLTDYIAFTRL